MAHDDGLVDRTLGGPDAVLPSLTRLQEYRTSLFGKWAPGRAAQYLPTSKGHDYFFGFLGGATDYFRVGGGRGTRARGWRRRGGARLRGGGSRTVRQVARTDPEDEDPELLVYFSVKK